MSDKELDQLEESVKKLRILYEKYFAGIERLEPMKERERVKGVLRRIKAQPSNNTAFKFRVQALQATLVTHETYWNRICRQIEDGTFKRDRLRAQRRAEERAKAEAQRTREDAGDDGKGTTAATTPTARARAKPAAAGHSSALEKLHAEYVNAQKAVGKKTINIDTLAKTIAKQTAVIKERYKCKEVEFRVAVKDGKAILKAVPK